MSALRFLLGYGMLKVTSAVLFFCEYLKRRLNTNNPRPNRSISPARISTNVTHDGNKGMNDVYNAGEIINQPITEERLNSFEKRLNKEIAETTMKFDQITRRLDEITRKLD